MRVGDASLLGGLADDSGLEGSSERLVVVVPSMTIDVPPQMLPFVAPILRTHEERLLCFLPLLRQDATRLIYVSSAVIPSRVVDYWLRLVPGLDREEASRRLTLLPLDDPSPHPLAAKLLANPEALGRIRELLVGAAHAYLLPSHADQADFDVASVLGLPLYGIAPGLLHQFGSKSGARQAFASCGVPHPAGVAGVRSVDDVVAAIRALRDNGGEQADMILKRDIGGGGHGNALVRTAAAPDGELTDRVLALEPDDPRIDPAFFLTLLDRRGGIVEELLTGDEVRSPSVLLRIGGDASVEVLATHEQVLGGRTKQSYLGCRFPAQSDYAGAIARHASTVGRHLADRGVIGHVGIDFICRRERGRWEIFAVEINPRMTGTAHHAYALRLLTGGRYEAETGIFRAKDGSPRYYVGSDELAVRPGAGPADVIDAFDASDVGWDARHQTGALLHTLSALGVIGSVGVTAIGRSADEAASLHDAAARLLQAV